MLPPVFYAFSLIVGLIAYHIQQRSQPSLSAPYFPQPVKSLGDMPPFGYNNLIDKCDTDSHYRQAAQTFNYDIVETAIKAGDKRVLHLFPKILKKQSKGKKLSDDEQQQLQRYRDATAGYQAKTHVLWHLSEYENEQRQKEVPKEFPMSVSGSTGIIDLLCAKVGFKFNHLQMTCRTTEKNKDFAFIQDTDLETLNFNNREDRAPAIDERAGKIAAYGDKIQQTFYPEYLDFTKKCR